MIRRLSALSWRHPLSAATLLLAWVLCAVPAEAKVKVNCNQPGQSIGAVLTTSNDPDLLIIVKGTCVENVVIERDDVTIRTNGIAPATIKAADPTLPAIRLDGAHRVVIDGVVPNGLSVNGGTFGISASRGSTLEVRNCAVTAASNTGIISAYGSDVSVDGCSVTGNGNGVTAANTASVTVSSSTVSNNAGSGIVATRSSYVRVGQDHGGTPTLRPVTVSTNAGTNIAITEGSSGNVVGGTVEAAGGTNIFVGRASSGQIGLGTNNLTGAVTVRNGTRGISVEGGNATIVFATITGNAVEGIVVSNAGSARIGILNGSTGYGANTIRGNATGIGVFQSGAAYIGGNIIDANTGFGVNVGGANTSLVGGNTISNNGQTGVFVRAGQILIGDAGFGLPIENTISGNGATGPNNGGIFAYQNGSIQVANATISGNAGAAVQAFEAGVIELRGSTAVTVPPGGATVGAIIQFGSTFRVRDTVSIVSNTSHGIQATNLSSVNIRDGNTVQGNGPGAFGVQCFNTAPMTASAATLTGNLTAVTGAGGATAGCNAFP
jgi:hypothetical protein